MPPQKKNERRGGKNGKQKSYDGLIVKSINRFQTAPEIRCLAGFLFTQKKHLCAQGIPALPESGFDQMKAVFLVTHTQKNTAEPPRKGFLLQTVFACCLQNPFPVVSLCSYYAAKSALKEKGKKKKNPTSPYED
ncbi:hypothetical protein E2320_013326, partial [Naja naja]